MPTYGYRCQSCSQEFEVLQRMSDAPEAACPSCNGAGKRLFYPAGILFKGSGFYKTDSRGTEAAAVNPGSDTASATSPGTTSTPAPASSPTAAPVAPAAAPTPAAPAAAPAPKPASGGNPTG